MGLRDNAPVGITCPDIDAAIEVLAATADRIDEIAGKLDCPTLAELVDDLNTQAANLRELFEGRRSALEELRSANDQLRNWGNSQNERADDAEAECKQLEQQVSELESI